MTHLIPDGATHLAGLHVSHYPCDSGPRGRDGTWPQTYGMNIVHGKKIQSDATKFVFDPYLVIR